MHPTHSIPSTNSYEDFQRLLGHLNDTATSAPAEQAGHQFQDESATHNSAYGQLPSRPRGNMRAINSIAHEVSPFVVADAMENVASQNALYQAGHVAEVPSTSVRPATIGDLRSALFSAGFHTNSMVSEEKISDRIHRMGTSPSTLLQAVHIAQNLDHPHMQSIGATSVDRFGIQDRMLQVFNRRSFSSQLEHAIASGNDDPRQIVTNLSRFWRGNSV